LKVSQLRRFLPAYISAEARSSSFGTGMAPTAFRQSMAEKNVPPSSKSSAASTSVRPT
jgi:hypothetical protein